MAREAGVSVIPVVIHGGHALMPKHRKTFAASADLWVDVLEPILPQGFDSSKDFAEAVHQRMTDVLDANALSSGEDSTVQGENRVPAVACRAATILGARQKTANSPGWRSRA